MMAGSGPRKSVVSSMNLSTHCCSWLVSSCDSSSVPPVGTNSLVVIVIVLKLLCLRVLKKCCERGSVAEQPYGALHCRFEPPSWFDQVGGVFGRDDRRSVDDVVMLERIGVVDGSVDGTADVGEMHRAVGNRCGRGLLASRVY